MHSFKLRHSCLRRAVVLALIAAVLLPAAAAKAQVAGLDQLADWYMGEVTWHSSAGLPVNTEFVGPLTAAYNWAFGATVLGVNVRIVGTSEYYCAIATLQNGVLDTLDTAGPFNAPARWDSGPYHIAAGTADGVLTCWLTAPRQYPQRLQFTTFYEPDTAFDFAVYPPQPVDATWANWWVTGVYQYSVFSPQLVVASMDAAGQPRGGLQALNLDGDLRSVAYMDYPVGAGSIPYAVFTTLYDRDLELGNNDHLRSTGAWFSASRGWYTGTLRQAGLYNGQVFLAGGEQPLGLLGYDESDSYNLSSSLTLITPNVQQGASVTTHIGPNCYLPVTVSTANCCFFSSARSNYPLVAYSDGTDIGLGFYVPPQSRSNRLEYYFMLANQGEQASFDGQWQAVYPVQAVAATAHWSTGNPELYWVQHGSRNNTLGALFHLYYQPRR